MIHRKFFKELTTDDVPWGVEFDSMEDLKEFLRGPSGWLAANIDIKCVLAHDFVFKIRTANVSPPATGRVYMTGNSGTNIVMIYVPVGFFQTYAAWLHSLVQGAPMGASLAPNAVPIVTDIQHVLAMLTGTVPAVALHTLVVGETGSTQRRTITHFSVTGGIPVSAAARLLLVAGFILKMMDDATYLHQILAGNLANHTVTFIDPDGTSNPPNPVPSLSFSSFTSPGDVPVVYSGDEISKNEVCDMLYGQVDLTAGTIQIEEGYIKNYV